MTRTATKKKERFFVEQAARLLGETWTIGLESESPDFIVNSGGNKFGLEVSELFTGEETSGGSLTKRNESRMQRMLNKLRREYEATANIALSVKFVGCLTTKTLADVVAVLVNHDFAAKPIAYQKRLDLQNGLVLHVTRVYRADWFSVNDRVGFVDRNPLPRIAASVAEKSKNLKRYQDSAGADVRLLLVADRIHNSGKLEIQNNAKIPLGGFRIVYFMSYPDSVSVFD